jgi:hypothetical protein
VRREEQQAGSLFYIALLPVERCPKAILAHPAQRRPEAQSSIGFQPVSGRAGRSRRMTHERNKPDHSGDHAHWTERQAGSLFYIALLPVERCPKVILAHPAQRRKGAQSSIGFQPVSGRAGQSRRMTNERKKSAHSRDNAQWTKRQAGSLFYIALLPVERCPKAILTQPAQRREGA